MAILQHRKQGSEQQRWDKNPREPLASHSRAPRGIQGAEPLELLTGSPTQPGVTILGPGRKTRVVFPQESLLLLLYLPQLKGSNG